MDVSDFYIYKQFLKNFKAHKTRITPFSKMEMSAIILLLYRKDSFKVTVYNKVPWIFLFCFCHQINLKDYVSLSQNYGSIIRLSIIIIYILKAVQA